MNNRKRNVADVALKLFVEKGIQNTSIQEIIENAGISKGTFYNYFTSKNDCVADILEFLRYDASQQRIAIQFEKDAQDRKVFIEQITILIRLNEERNLSALFEAILASNERELRKMVLRHRIFELEWLENRMIEVFGEDIRECAFEGAILFYGMLQHMLFSMRITNSQYSLTQLVEVILSYIELILAKMLKNNTSQLNKSAIDILKSKVDKKEISLKELLDFGYNLHHQYKFNEDQQDLFDALMDELQRDRIRKVVLQQFLGPFHQQFKGTTIESQVLTFINLIWYYIKSL